MEQPAALLKPLSTRKGVGFNCVPSLWNVLLDAIELDATVLPAGTLSLLLLGGERLNQPLVDRTLSALPSVEIWNFYGPTEATANASVAKIQRGAPITIGRPIANTQIYIVDSELRLVPVGISGQLHIGGAGLARGYLNLPDLTAEKFIPNPFGSEAGSRLYRSGDVARYLPSGDIELLGRDDHQVKIHGFRIEPGEIENALAQHPAVSASVVVTRDNGTETAPGAQPRESAKQLVAYIVSRAGWTVSVDELRSFLKQKLPEYMVPSAFVELDALPISANGKLNRNALPAPGQSRPEHQDNFVPPRTPTEALLAKTWAEVLNLEKVGIHDNFFEIGGNSLLAMQVISRLRDAFPIELLLSSVFENPTVGALADQVDALSWVGEKYEAPVSGNPGTREEIKF
jgi:acyl-CoA synthetase (AMP-forming)/AMP-acid ligase II/acyl carrier protein